MNNSLRKSVKVTIISVKIHHSDETLPKYMEWTFTLFSMGYFKNTTVWGAYFI